MRLIDTVEAYFAVDLVRLRETLEVFAFRKQDTEQGTPQDMRDDDAHIRQTLIIEVCRLLLDDMRPMPTSLCRHCKLPDGSNYAQACEYILRGIDIPPMPDLELPRNAC